MSNLIHPCRYCVSPERHPGCHDHCEKLKTYHESDDYQKLYEYKAKYLGSRDNVFNTSTYNSVLRSRKKHGKNIVNYRTRPWGD